MKNYEKEYYALRNAEGNLIGLDYASGGYDYEPGNLTNVWFLENPTQMIEYNAVCGNRFQLVRVRVLVEEVKRGRRGGPDTRRCGRCCPCQQFAYYDCWDPQPEPRKEKKRGDRIQVSAHRGKGLSYPSFCGTLMDDAGTSSGWDVVDVLSDTGEEISIYCFSIER